tara:strand:+ start:183 stop:578 length:396 start_codon:yes stop_codon:yes gene_type:complete
LLILLSNNRLAALLNFTEIFKRFLIVLFFMTITHSAAADSRLIMVTSEYCSYCQSWERDVGGVYNKSPYAAELPLSRVKFGSKMPKNVAIKKPVVGTPTFLIIHNGQEVDRQRGYTNAEMFFWWISDHTIE